MERENFLYRIEGSFGFNTGAHDCGIITQKLGIEPVWNWNKGDKHYIKRIDEWRRRSNGIWGYRTKPILIEVVSDITPVLDKLRELLAGKMDVVNELTNQYQFVSSVSITIFTEEEGAGGASVSKDELLFLSNFSSFEISYIQVENVEDYVKRPYAE